MIFFFLKFNTILLTILYIAMIYVENLIAIGFFF